MRKRWMSILMVIALLLTILIAGSGCSDTKDKTTDTKDEATNTKANAEGGKKFKIALVGNQKFGDNGPMDDMANGAKKAGEDFGVEVKLIESTSAASYEDDVRAMSKAGYNLIITTFPYMSDATKLVSKEYPDTLYSAIFQMINVGGEKYDNIWDTEFHGEDAMYISGYMAGKVTKTNRIGLVIGGEEPTTNAEGNGFMRGVKDANPNATVDFAFVGSYEDPAKAKEIASAMTANGCDVIQTSAAASDPGVIEAAKDVKALVLGIITDYYDVYDGFCGVIGMGFGETVYYSIQAAVEGNFPGGEHGIRDLANRGYYMDWASYERFAVANKEYGPSLATAIKEAKAIEAKILDGSLVIRFDTEVPNWERIKNLNK